MRSGLRRLTPCMSRDPQSADQLLRSDGLHLAAPTGSCVAPSGCQHSAGKPVSCITCLRRCTTCGVRLILITMLMVAVEMCTSLLVGIDVTFAMYSLLTVALLQRMKLDSCRAEVAVSGIIVTSFMIQDQFCQLHMACAFISIGFGRHANSLAQCRLCSAVIFYAACPAWPTEARLLMAVVGLLTPLFPPRTGAAASSGGPHPAVLVPALDAEVLDAVRDLKHYPKRRKVAQCAIEKEENNLAKRICKHWDKFQSSTRSKLDLMKQEFEEQGVAQKELSSSRVPSNCWRKCGTWATVLENTIQVKTQNLKRNGCWRRGFENPIWKNS